MIYIDHVTVISRTYDMGLTHADIANSSIQERRSVNINIREKIKHEKLCFTTFPNTQNRVKNVTRSEVFAAATNFEMFGNVASAVLSVS